MDRPARKPNKTGIESMKTAVDSIGLKPTTSALRTRRPYHDYPHKNWRKSTSLGTPAPVLYLNPTLYCASAYLPSWHSPESGSTQTSVMAYNVDCYANLRRVTCAVE